MDWLRGSKTYIVAGLMVLASLVHVVTGDMSVGQFFVSPDLSLLLSGLGFGALRSGIGNNSPPAQ